MFSNTWKPALYKSEVHCMVAFFLALLLLLPYSTFAATEEKQVPDLLDAPSNRNSQELNVLQLAVDRAGKRMVSVGERGIVQLSDDNGRSWRQAMYVPVSVALTDVSFVSDKLGWASGHSGVVLHTSDGGENWFKQIDGKQVAQIIYDEALARSVNGGTEAESEVRNAEYLLKEGADKPFLAVKFLDKNTGLAVGAYGIAISTKDGGKSWQSLVGKIPNTAGKHLYKISKVENSLIISGEQGALFGSLDGGFNFTTIQTPYTGTFFGSIGVEGGEILAFGLRGNVWRSSERLNHWSKVELGQAVTITSGVRMSDGSILLVDESGRVIRSSDKALEFYPLNIPVIAGLTGISEVSDGSVILTSTRGSRRVEVNSKLEVSKSEP